MADRKLIVEIVGDASSLHKSFQQAQKATTGFDRSMKNAGRGALFASVSFAGLRRSVLSTSAAFLGGAGFVAIAKSSVDAASNLAEQTSKTEVVFGSSAKTIEAWSKTTTTSLGLAEDQALATASSFGALLRPIGLTGTAAAQQSTKLTQLGADLASFYNTSVQDALDAIRSGLVGEVEPLRRYGVLLSETRVQQEAFNETGKKSAAALTPQEKVLSRLAIIFRDTNQAQGDFARTSDGLANQQRILQANLRQLQITIGQALIPEVLKATKAMNDWFASSNNQAKIQVTVERTASTIDKTARALTALAKAGRSVTNGITNLNNALGGNIDSYREQEKLLQKELDLLGNLPAAQKRVAEGYAAIEAARSSAIVSQPLPLAAGKTNVGGPPPTAAQQRAIALARFGGTGTPEELAAIRAQVAAIQAAIAFAKSRIEQGRGNVRKFADALARLYNDLNGQQARLAQIAQDNAAKAKAAADAVKAAAAKRRQAITDMANEALSGVDLGLSGETLTVADINKAVAANEARARQAAAKARQAAQFRALGLTSSGEALAPTRNALKAGLAGIEKSLGGTILDTNKNRNLIGRLHKVLFGTSGVFKTLSRETRLAIKDLEDALKGSDKKGGPLRAASELTPGRIAKTLGQGLGLSPQQLKALRLNVIGSNFTAAGFPGNRSGTVLFQGATRIDIDGRQVAVATHQHTERARHRTAPQTRGRVLP